MFMSTYAKANISKEGGAACSSMFKTLAVCAETLIFLMVGMNACLYDLSDNFNGDFFAFTLFLIECTRAINIFGLTGVLNFCREHKTDLGSQVTMWNAGLRGAIAFALAMEFPNVNKHQYEMINTTMWVIITTIFLHGGATVPLLKLFKLRMVDSLSPAAQETHAKIHTAELKLKKALEKKDYEQAAQISEHVQALQDELRVTSPRSQHFVTEQDAISDLTSPTSVAGNTMDAGDREAQKKRLAEIFPLLVSFDQTYMRPILCRPKEVQAEEASLTAEGGEVNGTASELQQQRHTQPNALADDANAAPDDVNVTVADGDGPPGVQPTPLSRDLKPAMLSQTQLDTISVEGTDGHRMESAEFQPAAEVRGELVPGSETQ